MVSEIQSPAATGNLFLSRLQLNSRHPVIQQSLGDPQRLHSLVMALFPSADIDAARSAFDVLYRVDLPDDGLPGLRGSDLSVASPLLLVQARLEPALRDGRWSAGMLVDGADGESLATRDVGPTFARIMDGQRLGFRLRANPTKRLSLQRPDNPEHWAGPTDALLARHRADGKGTGPRVALLREAEQIDWLVRQGERHGFRLVPQERTWTPGRSERDAPGGDEPGSEPLYAVQTAKQTMRGRRRNAALTHLAVTFDGELAVTDADRFRAALRDGIGPAKAYGFGLLSVRRPR